MAVTAALVKELRERTGAGMMDCKKALVETDGDIEKAIDYLREKGIMKAQKKAGRIAAEGLVRVAFGEGNKTASIVEVNSETDFVAKNEEFIEFVEDLAKEVLVKGNMPMEQFMAEPFGEGTVQETLTAKVAKIGENLSIRRFAKVEEDGVVYVGYTHGGGRIGVIVDADTDVVNDTVKEAMHNIAMQIAALNPKYVSRDEVSADYIAHEKEILLAQIMNDPKESQKPAKVIEGMITGRIKKELKEICLLDQTYVKAEDGKQSVAKYVEQVAKENGAKITVKGFVRYETGDGIEKKEENFAEEVAKQMAQ